MELQQYFILDVNLYRINLYLYQPAGRSLILKNCLTFFNLTDFQIIRVDVMYILFALRIHHENFIGKYNTVQWLFSWFWQRRRKNMDRIERRL